MLPTPRPSFPERMTVAASIVSVLCVGITARQQSDVDTRHLVETLAADSMEGRMTGSEGSRRAADEIVRQLESMGAVPVPGAADYRLPFEFTAGVADAGSGVQMRTSDGTASEWEHDAVRALSFSDVGVVSGPLIFAGYGLVVPESAGFSYDSYATLDVDGKVVVVLRYFPEDTEGELRGMLARYSGLRYKAMAARQRGAVGIIVVTGPRSPNAGELVPMTFDNAISGSNIHAVSVTGEVGDALLAPVGRTLRDVQAELDSGNPHAAGFDIPGATVQIEAQVERERRTGYNVVGVLPTTVEIAGDKPYVILGAHYDHLGYGRSGNSLARGDEAGQIHNGADDNASGVAAVLWAGSRLAAVDRSRAVVLAFWSGEELGLLGSADFLSAGVLPVGEIAAYVNFDMVGRLTGNRLSVQAVGTSPIWTDLVTELNPSFEFDLQMVSDPYLPTDVMSFNQAGVPSLGLFTGSHEDYHRPTDDPDTLNFEGLTRIADLGRAVTEQLMARPDPPAFVRVEQTAQQGVQTAMRIFTGTIPDYTQEAEGLLLSGVVGGGPAEAAGLQGGDVIIELAGHSIANIYDYTYALDLLRVGRPASIVYMRGDERIEAEILPRARQ